MGTQGERLARRFEEANANFIGVIDGLGPEQWSATCESETWTVGVLAHHVAEDHRVLADLIDNLARGNQVTPLTPDLLNKANAEHAQRAAGVAKEETVSLAQSAGAHAAGVLRALSDEQLTATMPGPAGEMTAASIAENVLIGHMGMHLPSIQKAAGISA